MHDPVTAFVVVVFQTPGVALILAGALIAFGVVLVFWTSLHGYRPLVANLNARITQLRELRPSDLHRDFAARLEALDRRFAAPDATPALANGWARFRSGLVEVQEGGYGAFVEASEAFDRLDEPAKALEWWAGILVALGLVVTFLGIVAALSQATASIGAAGASSSAAEASLLELLAIAATKFWTSIAGVITSIGLRIVARRRRQRIDWLEQELFAGLNACVSPLSPQRLLVDQLHALERIEARLGAPAGARVEPT